MSDTHGPAVPPELSESIKWGADGLVPAIAQEVGTGRIMMVAWMNAEALGLTVSTGIVHYWSRSRQCMWKKGETSGNLQHVDEIRLDCDQDVVLVRVRIDGATACHTGRPSCFFYDVDGQPTEHEVDSETVLGLLTTVIEARRGSDPAESWTARLLHKGVPKISEKIIEEAGELVEALADESDERVLSEAADLIFHVMVGLAARGLNVHQVADVLAGRFDVSGIEEKAGRLKSE